MGVGVWPVACLGARTLGVPLFVRAFAHSIVFTPRGSWRTRTSSSELLPVPRVPDVFLAPVDSVALAVLGRGCLTFPFLMYARARVPGTIACAFSVASPYVCGFAGRFFGRMPAVATHPPVERTFMMLALRMCAWFRFSMDAPGAGAALHRPTLEEILAAFGDRRMTRRAAEARFSHMYFFPPAFTHTFCFLSGFGAGCVCTTSRRQRRSGPVPSLCRLCNGPCSPFSPVSVHLS